MIVHASSVTEKDTITHIDAPEPRVPESPARVEMGLLTGCQDRPYAFELAMALISKGVSVDVIGSDEVDSPQFHTTPNLRFLNLRGSQRQDVPFSEKLSRLVFYYARLIRYAAHTKPRIFHILWNNRFEFFDRTLLMLYYKLCGKKVVLTAHNVNKNKRDANDSPTKRLTLKVQYKLVDHIFVHTVAMKRELRKDFGVREQAITVIPFGINKVARHTDISPAEAKQRLSIGGQEKAILFFGRIVPYKGLECLLSAFKEVLARDPGYRLIIAGEPMKGCEKYYRQIGQTVKDSEIRDRIVHRFEFIPDEQAELYFKAADVIVLPYKNIYQSGVLFLAYGFGTPVIAADIGSFSEDIIEGRTGLLYRPGDVSDLARAIEAYFGSDLYKRLDQQRQEIKDFVQSRHSWGVVGELTRDIYECLLQK